jgi:hypothetical protein
LPLSTFNCRLSTLFGSPSFDSAAAPTYNPAGSRQSPRCNFAVGSN